MSLGAISYKGVGQERIDLKTPTLHLKPGLFPDPDYVVTV